jgi:hypothetical protein
MDFGTAKKKEGQCYHATLYRPPSVLAQGDCMNEENISPQRREGAKGRKEGPRRLRNGFFCRLTASCPAIPTFISLSFAHLCAFAVRF